MAPVAVALADEAELQEEEPRDLEAPEEEVAEAPAILEDATPLPTASATAFALMDDPTAEPAAQATQTVDAYFYFLLPGKSSTSTNAYDYMYAGVGQVTLPEGFTNTSRWYSGRVYNGSVFDLASYVTAPRDAEIRAGLAAYYNGQDGRLKYSDSWEYTIEWRTLTGPLKSVGYDYQVLSPSSRNHVDCYITIQTPQEVTFVYSVEQPGDADPTVQSTVHTKGDTVAVNGTVAAQGTFSTDGYTYPATQTVNGVTYYFDGWYTDAGFTTKAADSVTAGDTSQTFYARYVAGDYGYSVEYYFDGVEDENLTKRAKAQCGTEVSVTPASTLLHDDENYVLVSTDHVITIGATEDENVIRVYYEKDVLGGDPTNPGDGVPDKYQAVVTYRVVYGQWSDGGTDTKMQVLTFRDADGTLSAADDATATLSKPAAGEKPDAGYAAGSWSYEGDAIAKGDLPDDATFTYTYLPDSFAWRVEYYFNGVRHDESTVEHQAVAFGSTVTLTTEPAETVAHNGENYVRVGWEPSSLTIGAEPAENVIKVYYELDVNGDNVPDKYQVRVTYSAENGTVSLTVPQWVTLYAADGLTYATATEGGMGHLSAAQIATATANEGYDQESLVWTPATPSTDTPLNANAHYVATFSPRTDLSYTVRYLEQDTGTALLSEKAVKDCTFGETYEDAAPTISGYVLVGDATQSVTVGTGENALTFYYAVDANGDQVPDKYQVQVTYAAVNGTVSLTDAQWVTLYDEQGQWALPGAGIGHLSARQVATATADEGYDQASVVWAPGEPVEGLPILKSMEFTATFSKASFPWTVEYYFDGVLGSTVDQGLAEFDSVQTAPTSATATYNGATYALVSGDHTVRIGTGTNVVRVYYQRVSTDTPVTPGPGDYGTPDGPGTTYGPTTVTPVTTPAGGAVGGGTAAGDAGATAVDAGVGEGTAAETVADDATPAAAEREAIGDEETPLVNLIEQDCWVHWWMLVGIVATVVTGAVLVARRERLVSALASDEKGVLGDRDVVDASAATSVEL